MAKKEREIEVSDTQYLIYKLNKLAFYLAYIFGALAVLLIIDVALLQDYSMREIMLDAALPLIPIAVILYLTDKKLVKWGIYYV